MPSALHRPYSPRDIALSRTLYELMVNPASGFGMRFVTYKEIANAAVAHHRTIGGALYYIQDKCNENKLPTLTAWVVRGNSGLPGIGCDVVAPAEVKAVINEIKKVSWPPKAWW